MKKLFYIILVIIILALIGMYVKDKNKPEIINDTTITIVEEENFNYDIVDPETGEVVGQSEGNIIATTTYDDNADGMIVEEGDDIIEENPDLTSDDDETIVGE